MASTKRNQPLSEGQRIFLRIESIRQRTFDDLRRLRDAHPTWPQLDARFSVFSKLHNSLDVLQMSVLFTETSLRDDTWWREKFPTVPDAPARENTLRNFALSTKHNFGMSLFIIVENTLRMFLRAIDPIACSGGMGSFQSIYECLLRSKLSSAPLEAFELLELVRLVRNTIHNDGVYRHRRGEDSTVVYKGETYSFYHDRPINFVTLDFLLMLANDIRNLFTQIVSDRVLAEFSGHIPDPTAAAAYTP